MPEEFDIDAALGLDDEEDAGGGGGGFNIDAALGLDEDNPESEEVAKTGDPISFDLKVKILNEMNFRSHAEAKATSFKEPTKMEVRHGNRVEEIDIGHFRGGRASDVLSTDKTDSDPAKFPAHRKNFENAWEEVFGEETDLEKIQDTVDIARARSMLNQNWHGGDRGDGAPDAFSMIQTPEQARAYMQSIETTEDRIKRESAPGAVHTLLAGALDSLTLHTYKSMDRSQREQYDKWLGAGREILIEDFGHAGELAVAGSDFAGAMIPIGALQTSIFKGLVRGGVSSSKAKSMSAAMAMGIYGAPAGGEEGFVHGAAFGVLAPQIARVIRGRLQNVNPRLQNAAAESAGFGIAGHVIHGGDQGGGWADWVLGGLVGYGSARPTVITRDIAQRMNKARLDLLKKPAVRPDGTLEARANQVKTRPEAKPVEPAEVKPLEPIESKPVELPSDPAEVKPVVEAKPEPEPVLTEGKTLAEPAVPLDPVKTTSLKNAVANRERMLRGLDPIITTERRRHPEVMDKALDEISNNKNKADELIIEFTTNPRPHTDWEGGVLLIEKTVQQRNHLEAVNAGVRAQKAGDMDAVAAARIRESVASEKLNSIDQATKLSGEEWGRSGRFRQVLMKEDFSLATLQRKFAAEGDFKPLDGEAYAKEQIKIKQLHENMKRITEERDALAAKTHRLEGELALAAAVKDVSSRRAPPRKSKKYGSTNKVFTREVRDQARQEILQGGLNVGLNPKTVANLLKVGGYHMEAGARSFARWQKAMIEDLGESVRPHLKSIFNQNRAELGETIRSEVSSKMRNSFDKGKDVAAMERDIARLTESFVAEGITTMDPLVDAVHKVVRDIDPSITRPEAMDMISNYGKLKLLDKDDVKTTVRELRGQMKQVAKLRDMAAGKSPLKSGFEQQLPGELQKELQREVRNEKRRSTLEVTDPRRQLKTALDTIKTRLENQIKDIEKRLKSGELERPKPIKVELDAEAIRLEAKYEVAKQEINREIIKKRLANRSKTDKLVDAVWNEAPTTIRAIISSTDFSAVLRQGGFISMGHPIRGTKAMNDMFRSFRSVEGQARSEAQIKAEELYGTAVRAGLEFTETTTSHKTRMEEAFQSRVADRIPLVAGSQRAYTAYLNRLRMDSFKAMSASLSRTGEPTENEAKVIANYINIATGRGSMNPEIAVGLNKFLWSPRLVASRFQLLLLNPIWTRRGGWKGTGRARLEIAKEYARFLRGAAAVYGLGMLAGATVEIDPRSSDFGKLRFGNTRLDPLTGLSQVTVFGARLGTGESKRIGEPGRPGQIVPLRGDGKKFGRGGVDTTWGRFLRTKLSPILGTGIDITVGENVVGEEVTPKSVGITLFTPLVTRDIWEVMEDQGAERATAFSMLAIFGMGSQTWEPRKKKRKNQRPLRVRGK